MQAEELYRRYQDLQQYVGWTEQDAMLLASFRPVLLPALPGIIEDFYAELQRHPEAVRVFTGGRDQVERLKRSLLDWLDDLFSGRYDQDYVVKRSMVGLRHVEIGLSQRYTNVAMSRLRLGLMAALDRAGHTVDTHAVRHAILRVTDLDLAIIEDAYQTEYSRRQLRTERLATIGQVAGGIAHELRNPLNVIRTSVYYLRNSQRVTPEKNAEHLDRIEKQVGLGDSVITALSNFARLPLPELGPIDLLQFFAELLDRAPLPENVRLNIDVTLNTPPVFADGNQLQIVFGNLLRNACDAMPEGGCLKVEAAPASGSGVDILVIDNGHGISPENLKRIMEPFFSTKSRGIGLGLALSRAILERNAGQISVQSTVGLGTTFFVRLPAARNSL